MPLSLAVMSAVFLGSAIARATEEDLSNEVEARLAFLEPRIAAQRRHAELWWKGWLTFYSVGAVVQGVRASWETEPAERADLWISCIKATGGAIRYMVDPYGGIRGLDPEPVGVWGESKAARLARAEDILQHNAETTNAFGPWYAHVINLGVNGTGAVIVGAGFDDWEQGLISAAIGFGVGEVAILTGPWEADDDLREYTTTWTVQPMGKGASLVVSF
jgi:hypothetical protein